MAADQSYCCLFQPVIMSQNLLVLAVLLFLSVICTVFSYDQDDYYKYIQYVYVSMNQIHYLRYFENERFQIAFRFWHCYYFTSKQRYFA